MPPMMRTPFGVSWDELELEHVLRFFDEAEDESLTWEAKGRDVKPQQMREAASAFGNSELGGVLVLGASQDRATGTWTPDRWEPREPEVELWVAQCLDNGGVTPRPSVAVKPWHLKGGGRLACVAIWPVAVPPVMTSAGQVWERTSSQTVKVTDPTALRRLFDRGRAAESRVHQLSNEAADELYQTANEPYQAASGGRIDRPFVSVLGFAATSLPSELSASVFRRSYFEWLEERVRDLQGPEMGNLSRFVESRSQLNQGGITAHSTAKTSRPLSFSVRVGRDGRVAVRYMSEDASTAAEWVRHSRERLMRMWSTAQLILASLDAIGTIHVAARLTGANGRVDSAQWSDVSSDGSDEVDRITRDVQREAGQAGWEPE